MILYLIRHGRQDSRDCNTDVGLSEEGKRQARLVGERMKGYSVDVLYNSHLVRAMETAQIAFNRQPELLANRQIREGLAEIDFGSLTGQEDSVVKEFYRQYYKRQKELFMAGNSPLSTEEVRAYTACYPAPVEDMAYPEGEGSAMVWARLQPVLEEWIASSYERIAVVTHGGFIRILLCGLFGGDFARRLQFGNTLENCSITEIQYDRAKGMFFLERFNDYAHLEAEPELLRSNYVKPN